MEANDQYIAIVREFEQKLYRKLTVKELKFIKWMVNRNQINPSCLKNVPGKIVNMKQWYRDKYNLPFS